MKTEKRHTIPEIRHGRFRCIKRNKGICDRCYGDGDTYKKYPGMYSKQKIRCSCPMCSAKTNPKHSEYKTN